MMSSAASTPTACWWRPRNSTTPIRKSAARSSRRSTRPTLSSRRIRARRRKCIKTIAKDKNSVDALEKMVADPDVDYTTTPVNRDEVRRLHVQGRTHQEEAGVVEGYVLPRRPGLERKLTRQWQQSVTPSRPRRRRARSMPGWRRPKPSAAACWSPMACPRKTPPPWPVVWCAPTCAASIPMACNSCRNISTGCGADLVNPKPDLVVERVTPVVGSLDGQNGYGFVVATKAMAAAMDMAREFGVGVVSARNSTHFGMAANYTLQAIEAGLHRAGLQQRVARHAAMGRTRGLSRHQPVRRRRAVRQRTAVRSRHVAGGRRARQNKARRAPRRNRSRSAMRSTRKAGPPPIRMRRSTAASCCRSAGRKARAYRC